MMPTVSAGPTTLFGSTAIYFTASALSSAIPFLLLPVLTRVLSPTDFGLFAMFSVSQSVLLPLVGLSTKAAISRRCFDGNGQMPTFITTCFTIVAASSLLVGLLTWALGDWLTTVTRLSIAWLFVALLATMAQYIIFVQLSLWQARRMAWRFGAFQIWQSATYAGFTLLGVVVLGWGWRGQALSQVATFIAFAAIASLALGHAQDLGWPPRLAQAREALEFGLPLVPHGMGGVALGVFDRLLLTNLLDVERAGLYTAALQISMVLGLLVQACNRAYMPRLFAELARDDSRRLTREVRRAYLYFIALAGAGVVGGSIAPLLATTLLGDTFRASAAFIPWLTCGVAVGGMYNVAAYYLIFARRTGWLSIASGLSGVVHVVASVLLIRSEGAIGAAQAFLLSQSCLFVLAWWSPGRRTRRDDAS